jgi:AmmeMemoRadiSam system protein B
VGYVVPHAGYVYSGPFAGHAYAALAKHGTPDVAVVLGPNHHGAGAGLALSPHRRWRTPLGELVVDAALGRRLALPVQEGPRLAADEAAHRWEHSIEVQLPFLQHLYGDRVRILPIAMLDQDVEGSMALGRALAEALKERSAVIIASSDFSHYLPDAEARERDRHALGAIQALDSLHLAQAIEKHGISMCGPGPVTAMMECMRQLEARQGRVLAYGTSGDTSGDRGSVVAYAAVEVAG